MYPVGAGAVRADMEGAAAGAMEERLARVEELLSGLTSLSLEEKKGSPEKKDPPEKKEKKKTPVKKKSVPKGKGTGKDHLPYGYDPVTQEEVKAGSKLVVSPDCSSPFKGKQIKVETVSQAGLVTFLDKKQKKTTQVKYLVKPKPSPSQAMARKAMEHYGLKDTDIFVTPQHVFMIIADYLGMTLEDLMDTLFDPCPPPDKDGKFAPDGRTVDWKPLTFCNPPFSQTYEWVEKCFQEARKGNRVILLMQASSYFHVGKQKKQWYFDAHREFEIDFIQWCDLPMGLIHKFNWDPNEITGADTKGPRDGVVIMDIKQRGKQYPKPAGSPSARSVSSMGEIEVSAEEMQQQQQRRAAFLEEASKLERTASSETLPLPSIYVSDLFGNKEVEDYVRTISAAAYIPGMFEGQTDPDFIWATVTDAQQLQQACEVISNTKKGTVFCIDNQGPPVRQPKIPGLPPHSNNFEHNFITNTTEWDVEGDTKVECFFKPLKEYYAPCSKEDEFSTPCTP